VTRYNAKPSKTVDSSAVTDGNLRRNNDRPESLNNDLFIVLLLILVWVSLEILVNPLGNFPLNDDWAYGWTVKTLLTTGQFQLSDWTAPNLLPQSLIGTLFTLPFGFSFTALRFSTVTLGLIGVLIAYGLLRESDASPGIAAFGALVLALNPLYFVLSNSFMTDVPSFTFFTSSIYCIVRGFKRGSTLMLTGGIVLSFVAILNRQSSIIIIPALTFAYFLKDGVNTRTILNAVLTGVSGLLVYLTYPECLKLAGRLPIMYNMQLDQLLTSYSRGPLHVAATYVRNVAIIGVYVGLFVLPFLIIVFSVKYNNLCRRQKRRVIFPTAIVVVAAALFVATKKSMPFTGNILNFFDVGGLSLLGYQSFLEPGSLMLIQRGWQFLTVLGVVGAALLVICPVLDVIDFRADSARGISNIDTQDRSNWRCMFVLCLIFGYLIGIAGLERLFWFDRYLILLLPLVMMVAAMSTSEGKATRIGVGPICGAALLLLSYGGVTVAGTHDHLASNRVLWEAVKNAMEDDKLEPSQIDGGFEFNGWYFGNKLSTCNAAYAKTGPSTKVGPIDFTCLFENEHWEYAASYVREPGFGIQAQYSFRRWLPWRDQNLYLLRKLPRQ
jgi:hypothetical protein